MTARISALVAGLLVGTTLATGAAAQERLGQVQFNVSCTAEAQQKFNRAMALYHSFGFKPATQAFTEIAQLDPKCGPMNSTILPSGSFCTRSRVLLRSAQTRGSSASRSRSPTRLMASTVARIASPGNVGSHQATLTKSRPSAIIWPQVG